MNMTDRFNPANENDPKRKLAYGLIALACVIALGFGLDAASCSRTGTAGGPAAPVERAVIGGMGAYAGVAGTVTMTPTKPRQWRTTFAVSR